MKNESALKKWGLKGFKGKCKDPFTYAMLEENIREIFDLDSDELGEGDVELLTRATEAAYAEYCKEMKKAGEKAPNEVDSRGESTSIVPMQINGEYKMVDTRALTYLNSRFLRYFANKLTGVAE